MIASLRLPGIMLALGIALLGAAGAQDLVAIPPLSAHVIDTAGMLDPSQRATLDNVLKEYEARSGGQIAILLIPGTAPETIEQYGIRVAEAWKLGRKGIDDGVLLVVAKDNPSSLRRLRIEAGRGIQGTVTDAQSKRILQDVIAPHFRQQDFYGGLTAGVAALTGLMDQEHLLAPAKPKKTAQDDSGLNIPLPFVLLALVVMAIIAARMRRAGNSLSQNGWGSTSGVILGSGFGIGSSGDSGSSSSSGDSGFSGGGGSFDGGGASGDW